MALQKSVWSDDPDSVLAAVSLFSCYMVQALLDTTTDPDERARAMLQVDRCDKLQPRE